jgi:hypothetical protein
LVIDTRHGRIRWRRSFLARAFSRIHRTEN